MLGRSGFKTGHSYVTLSTSEIAKYIPNPYMFNQFVDLVELYAADLHHSNLQEISKQIHSLHNIMPLKKLCMRFINELSLINYLHFQFVLLALRLKCPFEALPIVESAAVPYKFKKGDFEKYEFNCYLVFLELGLFSKAYKKLRSLAEIMQRSEFTSEYYNYAIHYLLMSKQQNRKFINEDLFEKILLLSEALKLKEISEDEENHRRNVLSNLIGFVKGKDYDEKVILALRQSDKSGRVAVILNEIEDQNAVKMRQNVASFKEDQYQRLRTREILNSPLSNPQTLRAINKFEIMARYNSKESVLYFNYDNQNESEINNLISRCYELTKAIKKIKEVGSDVIKFDFEHYKSSFGEGRGYGEYFDD